MWPSRVSTNKTFTFVLKQFDAHDAQRCSSSIQPAAVSKLIRHCCALTPRADVYHIWFAVTLTYRNIQVAIIIDCIQLHQGI